MMKSDIKNVATEPRHPFSLNPNLEIPLTDQEILFSISSFGVKGGVGVPLDWVQEVAAFHIHASSMALVEGVPIMKHRASGIRQMYLL